MVKTSKQRVQMEEIPYGRNPHITEISKIMNTSLQKINKIIYITTVTYGKIISDKTNTRLARKSKENENP